MLHGYKEVRNFSAFRANWSNIQTLSENVTLCAARVPTLEEIFHTLERLQLLKANMTTHVLHCIFAVLMWDLGNGAK